MQWHAKTDDYKVRENKSVFENWDMKTEWGTELYNCCDMTEMRV